MRAASTIAAGCVLVTPTSVTLSGARPAARAAAAIFSLTAERFAGKNCGAVNIFEPESIGYTGAVSSPAASAPGAFMAVDIAQLLAFAVKNNASDLHLSAGMPPMIRVDGDVKRINMPSMSHK